MHLYWKHHVINTKCKPSKTY